MNDHGNPCWYELGAGDLDAAAAFYSRILGWRVVDSGMQGFDYRLAQSDGAMVAGLMSAAGEDGAVRPGWLIYFAVEDCDALTARIQAAGGAIAKGPADIPRTGRFAVAADPQGAAFGLLQQDMSGMSAEDLARAEAAGGAFDQKRAGRGNWSELMSTDPQAAFAFYADLFGWTKGEAMDMGEMGIYQLFRRKGADIGAVMGLGGWSSSGWLPYFGVEAPAAEAAEVVAAAGGSVRHGPAEVPGPAWIVVAQDPQGAWFALISSRRD